MKKYYILLLLTTSFLSLFAQQTTMPAKCTNPGAEFLVGGSFTVSPEFGCLNYTNNTANILVSNAVPPINGRFSNLGYVFNFKDGDNIIFPSSVQTSFTISVPGTYWIMQSAKNEYDGLKYITCRAVEIIKTEQPDIDVSVCGDKNVSITFLDTPKNKTHGRYRIVWGDGNQSFLPVGQSLPITQSHNYSSVSAYNTPLIIAEYTRGSTNFTVCRSEPFGFAVKPNIKQLEGINEGESAKIYLDNTGIFDREYNIQQKMSDGSWIDTGKKINSKNNPEIITGLNKKNDYCFRLQANNTCGSQIFSNEVCTIRPNLTLLANKKLKLDWNSPDSTKLQSYSIYYWEIDSTQHPYKVVYNKNNSLVFDSLNCGKKYKFRITSDFTSFENTVKVYSSEIIYNPLVAPENIATVSVNESKKNIYKIFEPSGITKPKYYVYRSTNGNYYEKAIEIASNVYEDVNVDLDKNQYCYSYKYESECGGVSDMSVNHVCNVKLSLENTALQWTPFSINIKSSAKAEYFIEGLNENDLFGTQLGTTNNNSFNISDIWNNLPKNISKLRINAKIVDNGLIFNVFSNTINLPPLSTSNESEILNIYPNPSEEIIRFNTAFQLKTAEIIDLQGKIVENQAIEDNQVSVKNLPKGKYILRLYNQEKKLVVNKTIVKM